MLQKQCYKSNCNYNITKVTLLTIFLQLSSTIAVNKLHRICFAEKLMKFAFLCL